MGTEEFWIPAVIAAVSAGGEYANTQNAQHRQNDATIEGLQNQEKIQSEASAKASELTRQITQNTPQKAQGQLTGDYVDQLRRNAAGSTRGGSTTKGATNFGASTSSLAPVAGASSRYNADAGAAQQEVSDYGNTYAGEAGAIDAAVRQRQGEALGMQTLGTELNTLGAKSYTTSFVDQLRAQFAGQANPWVSLGAGLLKNGATNYGGSGVTKGKVPKLPGGGMMSDSGLTGVTGAFA